MLYEVWLLNNDTCTKKGFIIKIILHSNAPLQYDPLPSPHTIPYVFSIDWSSAGGLLWWGPLGALPFFADTAQNHMHEIKNCPHRPLATIYSTQSEFFFNLTRNLRLIRCSCFLSREKNTFVSNRYYTNTIIVTKTCFGTWIDKISRYPTPYSLFFPPVY